MMRVFAVLVCAVSLGVAAGCETEGKLNAGATKAGAPAGAARIDTSDPRDVYASVMSQKTRAERDAAEQALVGVWTPAAGWEGTVDTVTKEKGGYAVRMYYDRATIIGGGVWVVALVPGHEPNVKRRDVATVDGRISEVSFVTDGGSPNARVVLDGVTILASRKGN